jgi:hypothetical protein
MDANSLAEGVLAVFQWYLIYDDIKRLLLQGFEGEEKDTYIVIGVEGDLIFIFDVTDSDRLTYRTIDGAEDADVDGAFQNFAAADFRWGKLSGGEVTHFNDVPFITKLIVFDDLAGDASILLDDGIAGTAQEDSLAGLLYWSNRHGVFSKDRRRGPAGRN